MLGRIHKGFLAKRGEGVGKNRTKLARGGGEGSGGAGRPESTDVSRRLDRRRLKN